MTLAFDFLAVCLLSILSLLRRWFAPALAAGGLALAGTRRPNISTRSPVYGIAPAPVRARPLARGEAPERCHFGRARRVERVGFVKDSGMFRPHIVSLDNPQLGRIERSEQL